MKCSNCEYINKENDNYCYKCGKKLKEEQPKKIPIIINYITIGIIYAMIVHVFYLTKTGDEYTAAVAAWVYYFWIIFVLIVSITLLIFNIIFSIKRYKIKKEPNAIINVILLSLLHLPVIIGLINIH